MRPPPPPGEPRHSKKEEATPPIGKTREKNQEKSRVWQAKKPKGAWKKKLQDLGEEGGESKNLCEGRWNTGEGGKGMNERGARWCTAWTRKGWGENQSFGERRGRGQRYLYWGGKKRVVPPLRRRGGKNIQWGAIRVKNFGLLRRHSPGKRPLFPIMLNRGEKGNC